MTVLDAALAAAPSPTRRAQGRVLGALALGTAALVLGGCGLVTELTGSGTPDDGRDSGTDVFSLRVGDCLNDAGDADQVEAVPTAPCDEPHDSEIYASVLHPAGEYPGQSAILTFADEQCRTQFEVFIGADWDTSPLDFSYYFPTESSWSGGDREILCFVYDPAGPVTGSLQGAAIP